MRLSRRNDAEADTDYARRGGITQHCPNNNFTTSRTWGLISIKKNTDGEEVCSDFNPLPPATTIHHVTAVHRTCTPYSPLLDSVV